MLDKLRHNMGLFNFYKKKDKQTHTEPIIPTLDQVDKSQWTGKDFEFLITGNLEIPNEDFDKIMTPNSFEWEKVIRDECTFYKVGEDEYSFSCEIPGIQFTFNNEVKYGKAKKIADEIIENLNSIGQKAKLLTIEKNKVYKL